MPDSDLFGDLDDRWEDYKETLISSGWDYDKKERKWKKIKSKKSRKVTEQQACEFIYNKYDTIIAYKKDDFNEKKEFIQ